MKHIINDITVSNRCILVCTVHMSSHITHHINSNIIVSYPNDLFTISRNSTLNNMELVNIMFRLLISHFHV
jgi:hypothetical protein